MFKNDRHTSHTKNFLLIACVLFSSGCLADSPIVPDSRITPGDVLTTDASVICKPGYSKSVRDVPQAVKKQAYNQYGITSHKPGEFEVDHLISLELGGSNSIKNLWPESFVTQPLNAHIKDTLENKLHELICTGKIPVEQAQKDIATDWIKAYQKYVGALPGSVGEPQRSPTESAPANKVEPQLENNTVPKEASGATDLPDTSGNCPASAPIKVSKKGIYHLQSDPNYGRTKATHCFSTTELAEAEGYRAPK
jgi:hypothetical protein